MAIFNQKGNVLLFVISGIAMAAAIATGMFYMTSTSSLGQAGGSGMERAYYLALAGKDYAAANWNNRSSWNNNEFSLSTTEIFHITYSGSGITSTGIVNKNTPFEARKTIKVPQPSPARKHFFEAFEDKTRWDEGTKLGTFDTPLVSGDKALKVVSSEAALGGYGVWSFLRFNSAFAGVDLSTPWLDADRCLSHDLQVKIANNQPYYFAGLIFKTAGVGNDREFYGVSYMRTKQQCSWGCWSLSGWNGSTWNSCYCDGCSRLDNIPSELKPTVTGYDGIFTEPLECWTDGSGNWFRYSRPSVVLWKRQSNSFNWLAYKLLTSNDYVIGADNRLVDWSNLQVRLIEAYPLGFTTGGPTPLLHGAFVVGGTSGASARINGTPVLTSETWAGNTAAGTLTLTNVSGTFVNGENLLVDGVTRAIASGTIGAKTNYIRVYYGDVNSHGTQNDIPTDSDNRGGNPRIVTGSSNVIHWPVDNVSDWSAYYDYITLVQWDGFQASASRLGGSGTKEANAIIGDSSLLTPNSGTIDYSGIALHATGNTATSTYFDDFAIQY
ncbi:MAG: hypothetical protein L0Z73_07750 [Gammaproteobacteria bacterium]|nr:hypothetical protein [Gammaproteobacteria bacterium]